MNWKTRISIIVKHRDRIFAVVTLGVLFILVLGLTILPILQWKIISPLNSSSTPIESCNGVFLSDDTSINETYTGGQYYYVTGTCLPAHYQVVWLQPKSPSNFDLYLYNDSLYSNFQISSVRAGSSLEWVVFRSSDTIQYYVTVNSSEGHSGSAFIEWEDSSQYISPGNFVTAWLGNNESIEVFGVWLNSTSRYDFYLELPVGADYDLYLYRLAEGEATNFDGAIAQSVQTGVQVNEMITNYNPPATDKYAILVVRRSGNGTFTLRLDSLEPTHQIPIFDFSLVLFAIAFSILITCYLQKFKKIF